jgi:protein dithiol:quinone oxidoreductase
MRQGMSWRAAALVAAVVCAALLGFGYYLQYGQGLDPCPLCLVQRGFFYAVLGTCILGAIHAPRGWGRAIYGGLAALFAAGGAVAAGRQVWLQHLPPERVPQCGPDLYFMLENFPLSRTLQTLIKGTGECAFGWQKRFRWYLTEVDELTESFAQPAMQRAGSGAGFDG